MVRPSVGPVARVLPLVLGAAALLGVAGCNGPGADEAAGVARSFLQLAGKDPGKACDLLAGVTREQVERQGKQDCAGALKDENLPEPSDVETVDVYGHDARVVMDSDVVFLARYAYGWRVTAAGCSPGNVPEAPYDCDVSSN